jgi:ADP-ribosyl-[dinitrogen reductase] hydrolase
MKLSCRPTSGSFSLRDQMIGAMIGTAIGDSVGLPTEGMSPQRIQRIYRGQLFHRFILGRGMVSDDTEHHFLVAQSLLEDCFDPNKFQRCLAKKLRYWLLGLPAGIGLATGQALLKLWMGFPPSRSGVWSAGNGPAMRSPILGLFFAKDSEKLTRFVQASTRLTHRELLLGLPNTPANLF